MKRDAAAVDLVNHERMKDSRAAPAFDSIFGQDHRIGQSIGLGKLFGWKLVLVLVVVCGVAARDRGLLAGDFDDPAIGFGRFEVHSLVSVCGPQIPAAPSRVETVRRSRYHISTGLSRR